MLPPPDRAKILLEALPYIRRFHHKTIVIKYGGAAMEQNDLRHDFARDIVLLNYVGMHPIIVHGGGPQINRLLKELGVVSQFIDGHRVTDDRTMAVVEMVLAGNLNKEIVSLIGKEGGKAIGLSGRDASLATGEVHRLRKKDENGIVQEIDLGRVGTVSANHIDTTILHTLKEKNCIPVIAPIAQDESGASLNVNADTMAGAIASALKAEKLILLTDTPGVLVNGQTVTGLYPDDVRPMIQNGTITGGMIPKVECCLEAIAHGVKRTHIIDGRVPHSILLEILTDEGVGTLISAYPGA